MGADVLFVWQPMPHSACGRADCWSSRAAVAGGRMMCSAGATPALGLAKHALFHHMPLLQARSQQEAQQSCSSLRSCLCRWSAPPRRRAWLPGQPAHHTWQGREGRRWRRQPLGRQGEAAASGGRGSGARLLSKDQAGFQGGHIQHSWALQPLAAWHLARRCADTQPFAAARPAGHPFAPTMAQWQLASQGGT